MTSTDLDERYGRRKGKAKVSPAMLGAGVVAAVIVSWSAWVTLLAPATAKATTVGYNIVDAQHATVRFTVTNPSQKPAICAAQVLDKSYGVIGYKEVLVPAKNPQSKVFEVTVNTTAEGVTGLIDHCWLK